MPVELTLPNFSEEEALSQILAYIRRQVSSNAPSFGMIKGQDKRRDLDLSAVVNECLDKEMQKDRARKQQQGMTQYQMDALKNAEPFYCAVSNLCSRGILAPMPVLFNTAYTTGMIIGRLFRLTEYGLSWINQTQDVKCLPTEYAKFAQLLQSHSTRFGDGYLSRSREAIGCYEAHNFLACCAMCGAAAESMLLAMAIIKKGSQDDVLKEYKSANGRSKLENMLVGQQTGPIKQDFTTYMSLLKYWRDESAHGASVSIQEEEAFTSLLLLLRFAQFADTRWQELVV